MATILIFSFEKKSLLELEPKIGARMMAKLAGWISSVDTTVIVGQSILSTHLGFSPHRLLLKYRDPPSHLV